MKKPMVALLVALLAGGTWISTEASPAPIPAPEPSGDGAKIVKATRTAIVLEWETVSRATDYKVARDGKQLILAEETQTHFRDTDIKPGKAYAYTIDALAADGALLRRMTVSGETLSGAAELVAEDEAPVAIRSRSLTSSGWTPNPLYDTCPKWLHDSFWTYGPDNKAYPTWHPPIYQFANGSACRFGHEHGQDQRKSNLYYTVGPIPFGYVNEQLSDPALQRNEDHYGHKVAFFNGLTELGEDDKPKSMQCDVYFKLHQGTYSPDALKNNTHERFLNYKCPNGFEVRYKSLQPFGTPNSFLVESANKFSHLIQTKGAFPANQPSGAHRRIIPAIESMAADIRQNGTTDRAGWNCDNCSGTGAYELEVRGLRLSEDPRHGYVSVYNNEIWQGGPTTLVFNKAGTKKIFEWAGGPYWNLASSSRYYDSKNSTLIGHQVDLCYEPGSVIYRSADCRLTRARGGDDRIKWDDPRSPFNGAVRNNEANFATYFIPDAAHERVYFTPYGGIVKVGDDVPTKRNATSMIRGYFKFNRAEQQSVKLSNWAGDTQCGSSICWTNFSFYRLEDGTVVDSQVHAPN